MAERFLLRRFWTGPVQIGVWQTRKDNARQVLQDSTYTFNNGTAESCPFQSWSWKYIRDDEKKERGIYEHRSSRRHDLETGVVCSTFARQNAGTSSEVQSCNV